MSQPIGAMGIKETNHFSRYRTIGEMNHQEIGYIDIRSLGWSTINQKTEYLIFLGDTFSTTKDRYPDDTTSDSLFTVKIKCIIQQTGEKIYEVYGKNHINKVDRSLRSYDLFSVLSLSAEEIKDYSVQHTEVDNDWYEELGELVDDILSLDDDEEDEVYLRRATLLNDVLYKTSQTYTREDIERCLKALCHEANNETTYQERLQNFDTRESTTRYVRMLLAQQHSYILDSDLNQRIDTLGELYKKYKSTDISSTQSPYEISSNNKTANPSRSSRSLEELNRLLENYLDKEDYIRAAEIRDEIAKKKRENPKKK